MIKVTNKETGRSETWPTIKKLCDHYGWSLNKVYGTQSTVRGPFRIGPLVFENVNAKKGSRSLLSGKMRAEYSYVAGKIKIQAIKTVRGRKVKTTPELETKFEKLIQDAHKPGRWHINRNLP